MFIDLPLDQLREYLPERSEPADFEEFWERTLREARGHDLEAAFVPYEGGLRLIDTFDVTFRGFGGHPVKGWLLLPRGATGPLPCVVEYIGYNGGRGHVHDWLVWPAAGYATLVMDSRGQGGGWRTGDTPDPVGGTGPEHAGFMTRGVLAPDTYYYRRLITDAVRAVEAARSHPAVDPRRVIVAGISQGGGLALAVSGLVPDLAAALIDVPFLCHFRRAVEISPEDPYREISRFLARHRTRVEQVFATLDYFDGLNFAVRATAPALFSVALWDAICPPSTVFAAYNHYAAPKDIQVWRFNGHEGGQGFQTEEQLRWLEKLERPR